MYVRMYAEYYFLTAPLLYVLILYKSGYHQKLLPNNRFLKNFLRQFYLGSEFMPDDYREQVAGEIFHHYR